MWPRRKQSSVQLPILQTPLNCGDRAEVGEGLGGCRFCSLDTLALSLPHTNTSGQPMPHQLPLSQGNVTMTLLESHSAPCAPFRAGDGWGKGHSYSSLLEMHGVRMGQNLLVGAARELQVHLQGLMRLNLAERQGATCGHSPRPLIRSRELKVKQLHILAGRLRPATRSPGEVREGGHQGAAGLQAWNQS